MNDLSSHKIQIKSQLQAVSTPEKAAASRRYFPDGIHCMGASAKDISNIIRRFHTEHADLSAREVLEISEHILDSAEYHEETLVAFGLITKFVKRYYDDTLLDRFRYWLENYASNWAHVDDLCLKTIYNFQIARPHLIEATQKWAYSHSPWCRRAGNVVWVKFIHRKIGKSIYRLDKRLVFKNCDLLINDPDKYVQKSVGWLLKVTAVHHQLEVVEYIRSNHPNMERATIRYALEKVDKDIRSALTIRAAMNEFEHNRAAYNLIAESYQRKRQNPRDSTWNNFLEVPAMDTLLEPLIKNDQTQGTQVLDLGCGTGLLARKIAEWGATVRGIDQSEKMIELAQAALPEIEFRTASVDRLPFSDDEFDVVASSLVLHYLRDLRPALNEVSRVLNNSGHFVFSMHHPLNEVLEKDIAQTNSRPALNPYFHNAPYYWEMCGAELLSFHHTFEDIVQALKSAGFMLADMIECRPPESSRKYFEDFGIYLPVPELLCFSCCLEVACSNQKCDSTIPTSC